MNKEEKYPKDFQEFLVQFKDEDSCRQYLFEMRWPERPPLRLITADDHTPQVGQIIVQLVLLRKANGLFTVYKNAVGMVIMYLQFFISWKFYATKIVIVF